MPTALHIRRGTSADLPMMIVLERASATAGHWTEQQYLGLFPNDEAAPARLVLVAEPAPDAATPQNPTLFGFLVASRVATEWELENIVVAPPARRNGLGKRLLDALVAEANTTNSEAVFLEVRESNAAARRLYEKAGFHLIGCRKSYYSNPLEDAVLYRMAFR